MRRLGSLGLVGLFVLLGSVGATQYLAHTFRYAPELGPWLVPYGAAKLYSPIAWYDWKMQWGARAPRPFVVSMGFLWGGVVLGMIAGVIHSGRGRRPEPSGAYGTARWAETDELRAANLLVERGIVLCQTRDAEFALQSHGGAPAWTMRRAGALVRHDGPEHALVFAPTRSGKGVGIVVPTLLSWTDSVIVYDMKKENWKVTAGWRRQFSHCLRFEPTAEHSVRFNPLLEVRPAPLDVRDVQNIAEILVNPDTSQEHRDHWKLTGHAFLVAAILHVLYAEEDKSLAGVLSFITEPSRDISQTLELMMHTRHLPEGPHPSVAGGARVMFNRSENERSGVLSTAISFLELYRDPLIAKNTSASDFSIADLMCAERPVSLYLVVPPSDFDRTRPIMRLLLNLFGRRLTESLDDVECVAGRQLKRHRLLYLIDEFPSLGRMPFFEGSLAFLAGYKIKCLLIAQSLNQLDQTYGHKNSIMDNCHVRVTYGANDERTAKRISDMLGQASLMRTQISEGKRKGALSVEHVNHSFQEYGRPLKSADEVLALPFPEALVMLGGMRPYDAKKVMFYQDSRFADRAWNSSTGQNAPPDSAGQQRAELPPRIGEPHWLSLPPPERPRVPVPPSDDDLLSDTTPSVATGREAGFGSVDENSENGAAGTEAPTAASYWEFLEVDAPVAEERDT